MQYTVTNRGRPIGVTDLGFMYIDARYRSGWFHPNAEGERLMPVIASVLPAMRAYLHRDVRGADGAPVVQPSLNGSTLFADLAEALQHVEALELALCGADGSVVPTELVGIQDTEQLLAMAELDDREPDAEADLAGDPLRDLFGDELDEMFEEELDEACWDALEVDLDSMLVDGRMDQPREWTPEDEPTEFPRYQVHVVLADGTTVP